MPGLPNPWVILALLIVFIGGVTVAYFKGHDDGTDAERIRWELATEKQKKEAAATLAAETAKVLDLERKYSALSAELDKKDRDHAQALDRAYSDARAAAVRAGGLRDPGARRGCGGDRPQGAASTAPGGAEPAPAGGGALSEAAEQFLFDFARKADQLSLDFERVRGDAKLCRAVTQEAAQ
jgi:hypothetical protein